MPLVSLKQVSKAYGPQVLLDDVSLTVGRGARIGLIGRNGEGKSTLLKVMAGLVEPDGGEVICRNGLRMTYLPQAPRFKTGQTVFHVVSEGLGELGAMLDQYHEAVRHLEQDPDDRSCLRRMESLQTELDRLGAWQLHARIKSTISRLHLEADRDVGELSGGWLRRVALARAVVAEPDVLLLDEPTNHLDIESIEWLEDFVAAFPGAVLFITHDRYFLDAVAEEIIELDRGHLSHFRCDYASYLDKKADMLAIEERQHRRFDRLLAREERWIRKGIPARRRRDEGRVRALEELRRQRAARRLRGGEVDLRVAIGSRPGKLLIEAVDVHHRYGDRVIVQSFSHRIMAGERIGLIGPNGAGKTTLLKILLGEIRPCHGRVRHGVRLQPAFLTQMRALDPDKTMREVLLPHGGNYVHVGGHEPRHVVSYAQDFLFDKERLKTRVGALSGGERGRLMLARLLLEPANLLVLDEPTNGLDIGTLSVLEQALASYQGTVLVVSHDRAFMDRVVTRTLAFVGEGAIVAIEGGYSDYLAWKDRCASSAMEASRKRKDVSRKPTSRVARKLSYHEQRELEELPERIEVLETEKICIEQRFCDADYFRRDPEGFRKDKSRLDELNHDLDLAYARWEGLEAKREALS
ncbi:MAG: ATP-binding cassette domain-containing protein [Zetaproteobacteria bacterium]|nr:MAG: ATP-binding cassette domain-containing protein [Zetaproteobacteria bacterium]